MDANQMSAKELRALADQKDDENKVIKVGYLKMDLYRFDSDSYERVIFRSDWEDMGVFTKDQKSKLIESFERRFSLALKKGSKFVCYHYSGQNLWFDEENGEIEEAEDSWADQYLENIQSV